MKKEKIFALLLGLAIIAASITAGVGTALAESSAWSYDEATKTLTVKQNTENYTLENYQTVPWNEYKSDTEKIVVESGVTSIGDFAFCFESKLTSVELPNSLTYIGTAAFAGSDTLKELSVPSSVVSIGDNAFGYDSQMKLTDRFVASCGVNSYAQSYCLQNYIMFDSPVSLGENTAEISTANGQSIWSFAPKTNCTITFSSESNDDTYGLVYDAQTYVYSDKFENMKSSAIAKNDDVQSDDDSNLNFGITCDLEAGKRYYLSAKYKNPTETGSYKVNFSFECKEHIFTEKVIEQPNCETDGYSILTCIGCEKTFTNKLYALGHNYEAEHFDGENVTVGCKNCDSEYALKFSDYYNLPNSYLDVTDDGIVNAKDYAKLMREYK